MTIPRWAGPSTPRRTRHLAQPHLVGSPIGLWVGLRHAVGPPFGWLARLPNGNGWWRWLYGGGVGGWVPPAVGRRPAEPGGGSPRWLRCWCRWPAGAGWVCRRALLAVHDVEWSECAVGLRLSTARFAQSAAVRRQSRGNGGSARLQSRPGCGGGAASAPTVPRASQPTVPRAGASTCVVRVCHPAASECVRRASAGGSTLRARTRRASGGGPDSATPRAHPRVPRARAHAVRHATSHRALFERTHRASTRGWRARSVGAVCAGASGWV